MCVCVCVCVCVIICIFVSVQVALQEGLENVQNFFQRNSCRLPLSPSLVAKELNMKVIYTRTIDKEKLTILPPKIWSSK